MPLAEPLIESAYNETAFSWAYKPAETVGGLQPLESKGQSKQFRIMAKFSGSRQQRKMKEKSRDNVGDRPHPVSVYLYYELQICFEFYLFLPSILY